LHAIDDAAATTRPSRPDRCSFGIHVQLQKVVTLNCPRFLQRDMHRAGLKFRQIKLKLASSTPDSTRKHPQPTSICIAIPPATSGILVTETRKLDQVLENGCSQLKVYGISGMNPPDGGTSNSSFIFRRSMR
jgi:hypothetical protein